MLSRYGEWLDNAVWGILILLLVPAGFAITSWNSLPGSGLYGIRQVMEKVLVAIAPGSQAKGQLYVSFTTRGARDAVQVLSDNGSTAGLTYLNAHVTAAKENIEKTSDAKVRAKLARQYIATLREANSTLEQQKQIMSGTTPRRATTPRTTAAPTSRPNNATSTPAPNSGNPPPPDPVDQIEDTQNQIEDTIEDLEEEAALDIPQMEGLTGDVPPTSTSTPIPTFTPTPTSLQQMNSFGADQNEENDDNRGGNNNRGNDDNDGNNSGGEGNSGGGNSGSGRSGNH